MRDEMAGNAEKSLEATFGRQTMRLYDVGVGLLLGV